MKPRRLALVALAVILSGSLSAQTPPSFSELLEKGIYTEETVGDLDAAIEIYEQILAEAKAHASYVAQAQYRLGMCFLKKGNDSRAIKLFRALVEGFPEQTELVARARERLTALGQRPRQVDRQVWAPVPDDMGAPSPDGRYLSYVNWNNGNLAVHDLETGEDRDVTSEGNWEWEKAQWAEHSIWSPDGRQLAYIWYDNNWHGAGVDLRVIGLDGSDPRLLYRKKGVNYPQPYAWTKDGKQILTLFHKTDGNHELGFVSVADGAVRVIKAIDTKWKHGHFSLSPDGRYIVYGEGDISLMAADGSGERKLIEHPANDFSAIWMPDGKRIVFISNRGGNHGLWSVEVADGKVQGPPTSVKPNLGDSWPMGVSSNGSYFYFLPKPSWDLFVASVDFDTGKVLTPPAKAVERFEGTNSKPSWSPDGKRLAYFSRRIIQGWSARRFLVIRSVESGEEREFFRPDLNGMLGGRFAVPRWSPDGDSVVVGARAPTSGSDLYALYVLDVETGATERVIEDELGIAHAPPEWSPDGKRIYYLRPDLTDPMRPLVVQDLESGSKTVLYSGQVGYLALSPDGRRLAFHEQVGTYSESTYRLMVMPASGGEPRELFRSKEAFGGLAWTRDGRSLVFAKRDRAKDTSAIWRIAVKGGEPESLGLEVKGRANLSIHPDGRQIVYSSEQGNLEVWVIENMLPGLLAAR